MPKKLHVNESLAPSQIVDIDSLDNVELTDTGNKGKTFAKTRTTSCSRWIFERYKYLLLAMAFVILLIDIVLTGSFSRFVVFSTTNYSVRIQPESSLERIVEQTYPFGRSSMSEIQVKEVIDGDSSFSDQTKLTEQVTEVVEDDVFPMINSENDGMRFKRDTSRTKRDCELNAKRCKFLLMTVENYLRAVKKNFSATESKSDFADFLKCLQCKQLQQSSSEYNSDKTSDELASREEERYFPEEYTDEGRLTDSDGVIFNLLDDKKVDLKQAKVNRVGAARTLKTNSTVNTVSEVTTNQSLKDTTTPKPGNFAGSSGDQKEHVKAVGINNDSTTSVNGEYQTSSRINEENHHVTSTSRGVANGAATSQFITESSKSTTEYNIITTGEAISEETTIAVDSTGSTDMITRKLIHLTKQIAVNENVTSVPKQYDVIGVGNTVHPSVHPSSEGHSENQSATVNDVSWNESTHPVMSANNSQDSKSVQPTVESTKPILLNSSWTVHPVCFFGSPDQPSAKQMPPGSFYPGLSSPISSQSRKFPFQNTLQDSSASSITQTYTAQFMPKFGYAGNLAPTEQDPTDTVISNAPITEQPTVGMPYFCTYMSLPTFNLPPMFVSSQHQSSSDIVKDPSQESSNSNMTTKRNYITEYLPKPPSQQSQVCTDNDRRCDDGNCISKNKWCDNVIDCWDSSDEVNCTCMDRLPSIYICDEYIDCLHAEDENGCSTGCLEDHYDCKITNADYPMCLRISQRCDGIEQCPNRIDEEECSVLSKSYVSQNETLVVGYTSGYLHMNVHGKWYPVCTTSDFSYDLALQACTAESYPFPPPSFIEIYPELTYVNVSKNVFRGPYVKGFFGNHAFEHSECSGAAIYVQCRRRIRTENNQFSKSRFGRFNSHAKYVASENERFHELYSETLEFLHASESDDKHVVDNDTLVGIVGGQPSNEVMWPFMVAIFRNGYISCGGVIISESKILTAAHCVNEGNSENDGQPVYPHYEVRAGMLRFLSFSPFTQTRKAKYVITHPQYDAPNDLHDIAIILLDKPFDLNRYVNLAYLPNNITMGYEWEFGPTSQSQCVAIGYGDRTEDGIQSNALLEVELEIVETCPNYIDQRHSNSTLCAGHSKGGRDTCDGDSGGPLICKNPNMTSIWYVAGITSHGFGCGRANKPGVYMRVKYFMSWIDRIINGLSIDGWMITPSDTCPGVTCTSGLNVCNPIFAKCDGMSDCLNAEDEMNCQEDYAKKWLSVNNTATSMTCDSTSCNSTRNRLLKMSTITGRTQDPILRSYVNKTINNEDKENENITKDNMFARTSKKMRTTFTCKKLLQTIAINRRCDRRLDCEDGTDEENCTCREYLSNFQSTAICDGHLDCDDGTDEKDCGICRDDEFYCSKSGRCISMTKKCNEVIDCPFTEDEMDCLTLSDGEYVYVDDENWTILNMNGLLSKSYKGTWKTVCAPSSVLNNRNLALTIGQNACEYLGFASTQSVDIVPVNKTTLETRSWRRDNATSHEPSPSNVAENITCTALRVHCRPVLSSSIETHLIVDHRVGNRTYLWPWLAAIFVDGHYHCSAVLLEPDWLLSSSSCTKDIKLSVNYTTALLGYSRTYLYADGPYQQVSVIDEIKNVKTSDISLLHLKTAVNFTRYVQPLFLEKKIYPPEEDDLCVAVGTDNEHVTQSVLLRSVLQNCESCYRCFTEVSNSKCLTNGTSSIWSGTVFCRGEMGWYPAAVFHENEGSCSFKRTRNLTSIDYIHAYLTQILEQKLRPIPEPECNGVRCNTGKCVSWSQVCDDIEDCRDGADENRDICANGISAIGKSVTDNFKCSKSQLRCRNGMCIPKSAFCDNKVDCSDGTDEPVMCTCANYLALRSPERLCDGVRHCIDKSDESPEICACTETSFKCNTTSLICIPQDFVCDDDKDCPNGEDEAECIKINSTDSRPDTGEVIQRSYGVWHSWCFSEPVTLQKEAEVVCQNVGYLNGTIDFDSENKTSSNLLVPYYDNFYMIRLNQGDYGQTWITMRYDKPLITLAPPKETCHRLFVKCI